MRVVLHYKAESNLPAPRNGVGKFTDVETNLVGSYMYCGLFYITSVLSEQQNNRTVWKFNFATMPIPTVQARQYHPDHLITM